MIIVAFFTIGFLIGLALGCTAIWYNVKRLESVRFIDKSTLQIMWDDPDINYIEEIRIKRGGISKSFHIKEEKDSV